VSTTDTHEHDTDHGHHPTARDYVNIAVILAVLTALEVSTYFFEFGAIAVPMLIILMVIKFLLVVGWFMHLRFDTKVYSRLMYTGLGFALVLYAITLIVLYLEPAATL
jgi:cytochrome c oxidase subunit IV